MVPNLCLLAFIPVRALPNRSKSMDEHVKILLESLDHAIVVCDPLGTVLHANAAAANILQVESAYLIGQKLSYDKSKNLPILSLNARNNKYEHDISALMNIIREDKHLRDARLLLQQSDHSNAEFTCSVSLTTGSSGNPINIVLSIDREIEVSKDAPIKNDHEFNEVFIHADIFTAFVDAQGYIIYANNKLCEVTGRCWEEVIGKNWYTGFMPTNSLWKMAQAFIESTNRDKNVVVFEGELLTKDGAKRAVTFNTIFLRDHNQELVGFSISGEDITNRKLAETKLKESESQFRLIFEQSSKATFVCWPGGKAFQCNNAMRELIGCSCSTGKCGEKVFSKVFSISDEAKVFKMIKSVESGIILSEELEIGHKDGSKTWVILTTSPINMGGKRLCLGSMQDITNRKQSEQALAVREKEYRTLLQNIPDLIVRYDKEMRRIYVNPAWEKASGLSAKEVVDKNMDKIPWVPNPVVDEYAEKIQKVFMTGIPETVDFSWVNARDEKLQLEYVIVPEYDCFGNMASVLCVGHDLTERKNAEERLRDSENRLRLTLEATGVGIWDWDVENDLWHASSTYYSMLGYDPEEGYADRSEWMRRVHPEDRALVLGKIQNVLSRDFKSYEYEARLRHANGNYRWMYAKGFGIERDDDGKVTRMLGIRMDITGRKRAEQEHLTNLHFFESMDRVNRAILAANDLEKMMGDVLEVVLSVFNCDRAFLLYPCDPDTPVWTAPMERTKPEYPGVRKLGAEIPTDSDVAMSFKVLLNSNGPVKFGPESKYPLPIDVAEKFNLKSFIGMAIYPKVGKPWEFGIHQCSYPRAWSDEEAKLFQEIGRRISDALSNLLIYRDLLESERHLEEAQRMAHVGSWDRDLRAGHIYLSDEAYRIFGLPVEKRYFDLDEWHKRWLKLLHPDDCKRLSRSYEDALSGKRPYDEEYRIIRPTGEMRYIHSRARIERDESGMPRNVFGVMHDITGQKQAERDRLINMHFLESMDRINRAIQGTNDIEQMMSDVLDEVLSIFDCDRSSLLFPCDPDARTWSAPMERTRPEYLRARTLRDEMPVDPDLARSFEIVLNSNEPVGFGPGNNHLLPDSVANRFSFKSFLAMALYPKVGKPWEFGLQQCSYPRTWSHEEERLFKEIGRRLEDGLTSVLINQELKESEQKYRQLFEESFDGVFITSPEGRFLDANKRAIEIFGYDSIDELMALEIPRDLAVRPVDRELGLKKINEFGRGEFETIARKKNGDEIIVHISAVAARDNSGNVTSYRGLIRDVTEQYRAAEEIKESRKQVLDILESITDGFFALDDDWRFTYINRRAEQLFGIKRENLLYRNIWQILPREEAPAAFEQFNLARKRVKPLVFEEFILRIGKWLEFHVYSYEKGLSVYIHDITERKQAEVEQQRLNRELQAIRSCEQALLQAEDEQALLDDICRIVVDEAGYLLAWVGYVEHDEAKTIRPISWAGFDKGYIENARISWAEDEERGRGPSGTAVRSGKTVYFKDILNDSLMLPWRESALRHGFQSSIALPLKDENKQVFGVFQVYAGEMDAMSREEIQLMEELANDLAFGIVTLRGRDECKKAEKALRVSEERYRKAEAMGHVGNWEYNLQTNDYWCSDETKRIFGLDPDQSFFTLKDIASCISEREQIKHAFMDLVEEGKPYDVTFSIIPRNSSESRVIASVGELHRDEYGDPLKVVGIIQDITDLKKTEIELLAHLHFLTSMDRINRVIRTSQNLDEIMGNILDEVLSIFDCDRAYVVYPCDPESPAWSVPMERTRPEYPGVFSQGIEVEMDGNVIDTFKTLLRSDSPVKFGPESEFPLPVGIEERFDVQSMMAMVIYPKVGKPWQFGLHQCSYPRVWKQNEEKLFKEIGMRIVDSLTILQMHNNYTMDALSNIMMD
jgi:PAS domain S-box-containing protein